MSDITKAYGVIARPVRGWRKGTFSPLSLESAFDLCSEKHAKKASRRSENPSVVRHSKRGGGSDDGHKGLSAGAAGVCRRERRLVIKTSPTGALAPRPPLLATSYVTRPISFKVADKKKKKKPVTPNLSKHNQKPSKKRWPAYPGEVL
ncbi:hypothetical protein E2C01_021148 [Portunus trituberculatus]|uniref:Uncharacterized protein n=1 Tax=Portunus trituberculatus TaxID=210409 RepID=A0A5B7E3L1_PORTR|nr:hypothetical protein [Portunus trituberculatus]